MTDTITVNVDPSVCEIIRTCRNHIFEVRAAWGPTVSVEVAESFVNSIDAVFGLAHSLGGRIGPAGTRGLYAATPHIYAEMVAHPMTAEKIARLLPANHTVDEVAKILESFAQPVEWSVHS